MDNEEVDPFCIFENLDPFRGITIIQFHLFFNVLILLVYQALILLFLCGIIPHFNAQGE